MMKRDVAEELITARLLVLQSKRLMLQGLERRNATVSTDSLNERIVRMRRDAERAQHLYRTTVLQVGTPESGGFWLIAYGRLIETGNALVRRLRNTAGHLPVEERYRVSADVEALEDIIDGWTRSMRAAMSPAVA